MLLFSIAVFLPPSQIESQAPRLKVLIIGDSLTKGLYADSQADGFAHQFANDNDMDLGWWAPGYLGDAIDRWHKRLWRDVDLVIVELVLHSTNSHYGIIPDEDWQEVYGGFLDTLYADTGAPIIVVNSFWAGIPPGSTRYNRTIKFNKYIQNAAAARPFVIGIADIWTATNGCVECLSSPAVAHPWPCCFIGDNFHPNTLGHTIIADTLLFCLGNKNLSTKKRDTLNCLGGRGYLSKG